MKAMAVMAAVVVAVAATSCTVMREAGIKEEHDPAVKALVLKQVRRDLAKENITVSNKELSSWYDEAVASDQMRALADKIVLNPSIRKRADEAIAKYYPKILAATAEGIVAAED